MDAPLIVLQALKARPHSDIALCHLHTPEGGLHVRAVNLRTEFCFLLIKSNFG